MITPFVKCAPIHLVLFFTRDVSLRSWTNWGILNREVAIYCQLQKHGVKVSFVTYGDGRDLRQADRIPGIRILCNRWRLPSKIYKLLLPLLHASTFRNCDVIKTNQTDGADIALRVARFWKKPLIARCGWMWSSFINLQGRDNTAEGERIRVIERSLFSSAAQIVVTTEAMAADIAERIPQTNGRVNVIPNYVEVDRFAPPVVKRKPETDVVFVGRLDPQKNLTALLKAVRPLNINTFIIGHGPLGNQLKQEFSDLGDRVRWLDNVPNVELPDYLNSAAIFVLPSHYEGHPKVLIEAMACGLPVIGADSPGIREVIQHGETGLLCAPSSEGIRDAVQILLNDAELRTRLGNNARRFAVENYSLDRIVGMELTLLEKVIAS